MDLSENLRIRVLFVSGSQIHSGTGLVVSLANDNFRQDMRRAE
jgi:hypothetical protein